MVKTEHRAAVVLLGAALLGFLISNSPLENYYEAWLAISLPIQIGSIHIEQNVLGWINEGLMTFFFLLIGLQLRLGFYAKKNDSRKERFTIFLPLFAAVGGIVLPALLYVFINLGDQEAIRGWAIPTATDVAFSLGMLSLLGARVSTNLRLLLVSIAIIDDLAAILIIAFFYVEQLSVFYLLLAFMSVFFLMLLNDFKVKTLWVYGVFSLILWYCLLQSGVHATLAGIVLSMVIPVKAFEAKEASLLALEKRLDPWVAFFILPLFAFANAGVSLKEVSLSGAFSAVPVGIAIGLILGKPLGILGASWFAVRFRWVDLPEGMSWLDIVGMGALCGIGFTMSLLIGSLSFPYDQSPYVMYDRAGILVGSIVSAILGWTILKYSLGEQKSR